MNNSLTYKELEDMVEERSQVWDSRYGKWVTIKYGVCCLVYRSLDGISHGEIYRGDETGRFFKQSLE